jgi:uncharacterized protein YbjT (DUF2867 family)
MKQSVPILVQANGRNFSFIDSHVTAARHIAEAVAKHNVSRFIHVSSYNADPKSPSKFYSSKVSVSLISLIM